MKNETSKQKNLKFFGIGKVLPYLKNYKKPLFFMILGSLVGSLVDTGVPLFQRYALNHFIGEGTLDTIVWFVILYLTLICGGACDPCDDEIFAEHFGAVFPKREVGV